MRVLIVLPGALGDVVRALPLLGRLRRGWPAACIGWVVEPLSAPLLRGHPWLDEVLLFERSRGLAVVAPFLRRLRAGGWEVAVDLGRGVKSALIARASGATDRVGFARTDGREGGWLLATRRLSPQGHERSKLEQFLAFGDLLGLPVTPVDFGLAPTAAEAAEAAALLAGLPRPLLAASLGSSCSSRTWFPDRTAAVLDEVATRHGGAAVLLGTSADAEFAAGVVRHGRSRMRDLTGRTTLRQLLAVVKAVDLVFGPDSGTLHLAAAMSTPVISLWGATSARRSAPWGSERWTVSGGAPCAPCFLRACPIGRVCMQQIAPADVLACVGEALAA